MKNQINVTAKTEEEALSMIINVASALALLPGYANMKATNLFDGMRALAAALSEDTRETLIANTFGEIGDSTVDEWLYL